MKIKLPLIGLSIEIVCRLPGAFYVFTPNHEFAWGREDWYEWPSGKWRHWVIERRARPVQAVAPIESATPPAAV
jgi:hypothetical protein